MSRKAPIRFGTVLAALSAALLLLGARATPSAGSEAGEEGLLDGMVFVVEKGEMGERPDAKDTYLFRKGKFRSANYERAYGFGEGAYAARRTGDAIAFRAETGSEAHGTIRWEGTVRGDDINVRYTWTGGKRKWYGAVPKPKERWARSVTGWATEDPGPPGGGPPSNLLDGKTFHVRSGERGKEASHHHDYLVFRDGTFVSSDCLGLLDFRVSAYSAAPEGDGIRFRAETTSPRHGTMIWDGIVRGDAVDAEARWIHKRWYWTVDRMYWFKGRLLE